jgi:hypothetical protein
MIATRLPSCASSNSTCVIRPASSLQSKQRSRRQRHRPYGLPRTFVCSQLFTATGTILPGSKHPFRARCTMYFFRS